MRSSRDADLWMLALNASQFSEDNLERVNSGELGSQNSRFSLPLLDRIEFVTFP
jgi:hypothetical protein